MDPWSLKANVALQEELDVLAALVEGQSAVIHFYLDHDRHYLLGVDELASMAPCLIARDELSTLLSSGDHPLCA